MCKRLICSISFALALGLLGNVAQADIVVAEQLLVDLRAEDLAHGEVTTAWPNHGTLGDFAAQGTPVVESIAGMTCVTFDGASWFDGPASTSGIEGAGTRSIEVWAYNPDIPGEETTVSWAHRGGPAGTNMSFNYGNHNLWGAVGHWSGDTHDMGWWGTHSPAPATSTWWHLTYTYDGTAARVYVNGVQESVRDPIDLDTYGGTPIRVAAQADGTGAGADGAFNFTGSIAQVRIHDGVLSPADIMNNFKLGVPKKAHTPNPPDGATGVLSPVVQWKAGATAQWHDIYFGTNPTPGAAEYRGRQLLAWTLYFHLEPLVPGVTYYWRIDEVEADGTTINTGDVWSFMAAPLAAYNPDPPDGARYVQVDADLSWAAGSTAASHDVYFGTDETEVTNGTGGTSKGNQPGTTYEPGTLAKGTTYYWRIDEVESNLTTKYTGDVWRFRTIPEITISDPNLVGWWKFDEGRGTTAFDWSGHGQDGILRGGPQWVPGYGGSALGSASADSIVGIPHSLGIAPAQGALQWVPGFDGGALKFDGIDDYVELPIGSLIASLESTTVTTWVNFSNLGGAWQRIFDFGNNTTVYMFLTPRLGTAGEMRFGITIGGGGDPEQLATAPSTLPTGWHHVAVTISTSTITLYLDGADVATGSTNLTPSDLGNTTNNWLGRSQWAADAYLNGSLDDFRIYNYALSQAEIPKTMRGDPTLAWNPSPLDGSTPDIEGASPLTWSPGDNAAKHDVYFGTDEDAVIDADTTTTGVYRGRIDPNSYTPPEALEFGQTYYWRIDEFNTDATISEGRIWSFAVADYLIIDDFEPYDDFCNRIFYVWPDGWGYSGDLGCGVPLSNGNGTGSTVGYLAPPYAEQTIVNGGRQAMPMEFLNDGSTGKALYSETERTFDPAQDWTRHDVKALTLWFRGVPASVGSFGYDAVTGIYTITATGADIWDVPDFPGAGPGNFHDEFHYGYKRLSGVGTIVAQVLSVGNTDGSAKAAVMIRETLDANSVHAMAVMTPGNSVLFEGRTVTGGASFSTSVTGITVPHWVRLTRSGNTLTGEHSTDGSTWETVGTQDIPMAASVYVGLALTSHNVNATCVAQFSDVTTTGTVTGQWQSQDIGIASNVADQLYVAIEDSAGNSKVVNHPDPDAALSDAYQEWNIDLADFAPVDVTRVKKMYIGVGDRNAPTLGGAGMLYIDDIRLYQPRCFPDLATPAPYAYVSNDCIVDYSDLEIMASDWLVEDRIIATTNPGTASLVGHWKFDDGSGTAAADFSVNDNDGALHGGPQWIAGYDGGALEFDGGNDYVELPIGSVINSLTNSTFATWVDFSNAGGAWQRIFDFGNDTTAYMFLTPRLGTTGPMRFGITIEGGGSPEQMATAPTTLASGWHHVAVTIDADGDTITLYLDAAVVAQNTEATLSPSDLGVTTSNWLGRSQYAVDAFYRGLIDDFRIYSRALTQAEVAHLADRTPGDGQFHIPVPSPAELYQGEPEGSRTVNFMDFVVLADSWLDVVLWP